jgi:hypothetical protein
MTREYFYIQLQEFNSNIRSILGFRLEEDVLLHLKEYWQIRPSA